MLRVSGGRCGQSLSGGIIRRNININNHHIGSLTQSTPTSNYRLQKPQQQQQHVQQQTRLSSYIDEDAPKLKQLKVKKKEKRVAKQSGKEKNLELVLAALDAPLRKEPPISEEEKLRRHEIGKQYVIGRFRQHNMIDHDLTCKIHMKNHAIKMLPQNSKIKEAALIPSDVMPPLWRNIPVWTAPIPGFNPAKYIQKREDE